MGVGEVISFCRVQCQAQLAFVGAKVISHKIRVLCEVDRLKGELTQTLATIEARLRLGRHATTAAFCATRETHAKHQPSANRGRVARAKKKKMLRASPFSRTGSPIAVLHRHESRDGRASAPMPYIENGACWLLMRHAPPSLLVAAAAALERHTSTALHVHLTRGKSCYGCVAPAQACPAHTCYSHTRTHTH